MTSKLSFVFLCTPALFRICAAPKVTWYSYMNMQMRGFWAALGFWPQRHKISLFAAGVLRTCERVEPVEPVELAEGRTAASGHILPFVPWQRG